MTPSMRELLGLANLPKAKGSTESASSTATIRPVMMHLLILIAYDPQPFQVQASEMHCG